MNFSSQFSKTITNIEEIGSVSQPRDMKVKELALTTLPIDPYMPIANFENRKSMIRLIEIIYTTLITWIYGRLD